LVRTQAGFHLAEQVLTQYYTSVLISSIKDGFQMRKKTTAVLINLTATYDKIWHQSPRLMVLQTIPDHNMAVFIMETISNSEFTLWTSDGQQSRPWRL